MKAFRERMAREAELREAQRQEVQRWRALNLERCGVASPKRESTREQQRADAPPVAPERPVAQPEQMDGLSV